MSNIITVREDVEVSEVIDIDVDLEDYIDEIADFLRNNKTAQEQIALKGGVSFDREKFNFTEKEIKDEFSLDQKQLEAHLRYKSTDSTREYMKNHNLLIKDSKIEGIFTSNGHSLIISSNNIDNCINKIINDEYEVKLFNFNFINPLPKTSLSFVDNEIYSHFDLKQKSSTKIIIKGGDTVKIKAILDNLSKDFRKIGKKSVKDRQDLTALIYNDKISIHIANKYYQMVSILDKDYKCSVKANENSPVCFKDKKNMIIIMPIRQ